MLTQRGSVLATRNEAVRLYPPIMTSSPRKVPNDSPGVHTGSLYVLPCVLTPRSLTLTDARRTAQIPPARDVVPHPALRAAPRPAKLLLPGLLLARALARRVWPACARRRARASSARWLSALPLPVQVRVRIQVRVRDDAAPDLHTARPSSRKRHCSGTQAPRARVQTQRGRVPRVLAWSAELCGQGSGHAGDAHGRHCACAAV